MSDKLEGQVLSRKSWILTIVLLNKKLEAQVGQNSLTWLRLTIHHDMLHQGSHRNSKTQLMVNNVISKII